MTYSEFQEKVSSEKLVLATLDASKRLMGWTLHSGSIYKIENFSFKVITSVEDSGTAYTEASSIGDVTASKYFLDQDTDTLYLRASDSSSPNSRFIVVTVRLHLANAPITLPHDLSTGFEVFWEPWIKTSSAFGTEIDTINQMSEAIEGSGSLTLHNEQTFWQEHFDKFTFENRDCYIYSYNRDLDISEVQPLFKGKVESRSFKPNAITFNLRDTLTELRNAVSLSLISDLALRHSDNVDRAYQRMIFGRVFGYRPTNVDEVNDGYPITGTIAVTNGSASVTGTGTSFLLELSRDDKLIIESVEYTVASVTSATALTLTENYVSGNDSGLAPLLIPDQPKRWMNRVWKVAGHAICQPTTTTIAGSTTTRLYIDTTEGFFDGDTIYVGDLGSGEIATVESVMNERLLKLSTSLLTPPIEGVSVIRPAIQSLRINDLLLRFDRDYAVNATTGVITLKDDAEANAAPLHQMSTNLAFTDTSRTVTGTGLDAIFKPGYMVGCVGQVDMFEVLDVSETSLTLRTPATFTDTDLGTYKSDILSSDSIVTCDVLGRTDDGTSSGGLLRTAPAIVRQLMVDAGLTARLDETSFTDAASIATQDIGISIPSTFDDSKPPTYREVINKINKSVLGSLIQGSDCTFKYLVIQPQKTDASLTLTEADVLSFSIEHNAKNILKTVQVEYQPKEYNYLIEEDSKEIAEVVSVPSTYVLKTDKTKIFTSNLVETRDAEILASRLSFIYENSSGMIKFKTKLQAASLEIGDVIDLEHEKLYVRLGRTDKRRLLLVEKVSKNGLAVEVEAVDLSNAFSRCAAITPDTYSDFTGSSDEDKLFGGYITDEYGMQDNDSETFDTNLIW